MSKREREKWGSREIEREEKRLMCMRQERGRGREVGRDRERG